MNVTLSHRIITAVLGAAVALGAQALAPRAQGGGAAPGPANAAVLQEAAGPAAQAAAVRYWTAARMTAALRAAGGPAPASPRRSLAGRRPGTARTPGARRVPARQEPWLTGNTGGHGLRWTHGGAVTDAVGKIFFTLNDADYVCSGTLVGGARSAVVLTAAHCVAGAPQRDGAQHGSAGDWATNWLFVPGYRDGQMPYGEYTAREFFVSRDWNGPSGGTEQYDVAFVQIAAGTRYGGSGAATPPPGLPVAFASRQDTDPAGRGYVFGYPALAPYTGLYPNYCAGPAAGAGGSVAMSCGMTAGDSGGPWLAGFRPRPGSGTVVAVSAYKLSGDPRVLYGAVLGPRARALYARAVRPVG
jgi:V8-like Glu-specific endopeptidase